MAARPPPEEISPRPERESDRHGTDRPGDGARSRSRFESPAGEVRCDRRGVSGARLFGARRRQAGKARPLSQRLGADQGDSPVRLPARAQYSIPATEPATQVASVPETMVFAPSDTSTTSIATMLTRSCAPSSVPRVTASMLEVAAWDASFPSVGDAFPGTMSTEIAIAAGVLMIEAIRMCPSASGITFERMLA